MDDTIIRQPKSFLEKATKIALILNHLQQLIVFEDLDEVGEMILSIRVMKPLLESYHFSDDILLLVEGLMNEMKISEKPIEEQVEYGELIETLSLFFEKITEFRIMVDESKTEDDLDVQLFLNKLKKWKNNIPLISDNGLIIYVYWVNYILKQHSIIES